MSRLLIVANRLPVTVTVADDGSVEVQRSAGGLATGLSRPHEQGDGLWIGWPGVAGELPGAQQAELEARLAEMRLVPVALSEEEVREYYEGFANGVLWPVFHYLVEQMPLHVVDWGAYEAANRKFADAVAAHYRPGDTIWVHDYQLLLVPGMLRAMLPEARIGFFLHIPFPSSEVFRTLSGRTEILRGLLGADLIGFHTAGYLRHFASSLTHLLGLEVGVGQLRYEGREVRLGVFPMGIDAEAFGSMGSDPEVQAESRTISEGVRMIVGIDRLDYTKGIPRRLLAYEHLLKTHPEWRERVRLVQVAVPSRTGVEAYQEYRESLDTLMGRIQGAYSTPVWAPIHYLYRSLSEEEVVALYRSADVMLVTPIRDGMNLVAKEFIAARTDGDGVLVLSEFAGAASELAEAVHVNPYDVEEMARSIHEALIMPEDERRSRMAALRKRVMRYDVHWWVRTFLAQLAAVGTTARGRVRWSGPQEALAIPVDRLREAERLLMLLDYDGTLAPIAPRPELAAPDAEVLELLAALARRPGTEVHVVSGRKHETLEEWLGALPIGLHAEHGMWSRPVGEGWVKADVGDEQWCDPVRAILDDVTARTPGSLLEEKTAGFAWHYRLADPTFGELQANELRLHLTQLLSNQPVEILTGHKVVEVRPHGVHKGRIVTEVLRRTALESPTILAIGDDRTDEDLFAALPDDAVTVRVGEERSSAKHRLGTVDEVRGLLRLIAEGRAVEAVRSEQ